MLVLISSRFRVIYLVVPGLVTVLVCVTTNLVMLVEYTVSAGSRSNLVDSTVVYCMRVKVEGGDEIVFVLVVVI